VIGDAGRLLRLLPGDFRLAHLSDELGDLLLEGVEASCQFAPAFLILASEVRSAFGDHQGRHGEGEDQNN